MHHFSRDADFPIDTDSADYGAGYTHGKDKAHFEVRMWDGSHSRDCGCEPCETVRAVIAAVAAQASLLPRSYRTRDHHHLQDCAGPGCGASCLCWCHVGGQ